MRPLAVRTALPAALLPLLAAGCYTVLSHPSHPEAGSSQLVIHGRADGDALAPLRVQPAPGRAGGSSECLRCHLGHSGNRLDAIGRSTYLWERGLDPRWPSSYSRWLGYLPDRWLGYYRDRYWYDPWLDRDRVIVVEQRPVDTGPPPERGSRHLWGRRNLQTPEAEAGRTAGVGDPEPRRPEPPARTRDERSARQPESGRADSGGSSRPSEPERGTRHLWGRRP